MFDPNSLLTKEELTTPRTPTELARWTEDKCRLFADCPETKKWALLRKGPFKKFYEEIYPLSIFATHLYSERSDIQCIPNLDNRDFDAIILDHSTSPPSKLKIEITSAVKAKDQYLRMKYFVKHGHVNVWGTLSASGTEKVGHEIHVENEMIDHATLLERTFSLIRSAFEGKSVIPNKPPRFGQGHVLIIVFDDWQWFNPEQEMAALKDFVKKHVLTLPLDFAALYVVGLSGNTFVHFEPPKIQHSPAGGN
jgi:hypothetical protein